MHMLGGIGISHGCFACMYTFNPHLGRSFDQFANLIMEHSVERIVVGTQYAEVALGLYVVRIQQPQSQGTRSRRGHQAVCHPGYVDL